MLLGEREKEKTHTHTHEKTATEETRRTQNPNARKPQHKRQEELETLKLETDLRQVEEGEAHPDCFRSNSSKLPSKSWMPQNNRDPMTHYPDPSSNHAQILHQIMWRGKCVTKDQIYKTLILNSLACRSISCCIPPRTIRRTIYRSGFHSAEDDAVPSACTLGLIQQSCSRVLGTEGRRPRLSPSLFFFFFCFF